MTASSLIPRTCTEVATDEWDSAAIAESQPLSSYRDVPAYVLIGEPGAGKTTEFEQERRALGTSAERISARRFAKVHIANHPEWRDKVLFIDGLDETRTGGRDATTALDEIQSRLDALGRPRFRISCRAADWLGSVDRRPLTEASPDGEITTLRLEALNRSDVRQYLKARIPSGDPVAFILKAESLGLGPMLDNPLTLKLLIKSTGNDGWPSTRREAFERSCRMLAQEPNPEHPRSAHVHPPELTLVAAGRLCAIQLLAGKDGYVLLPAAVTSESIPVAEVAADIAAAVQRPDLDVRDVFATNLFASGGDLCLLPQHRQITEYLAAAHIADLIESGSISMSRLRIAMTSRFDDRIVTDLRGLAAWLGTVSGEARREFIASDPVGAAIYGDIAEWPADDRREFLDCLAAQARPEDLWGVAWFDTAEHRFRDMTAWSFRSLCKPDIADALEEYLGAAQRGTMPSHVLELLLRSLFEAEDAWLDQLSSLAPRIGQLALDMTTQPDVRLAALLAFARIEPSASEVATTLGVALDAVRERRFADPDDKIGGALLRLLYLRAIAPSEIWAYAPLLHRGSFSGESWGFWRNVLCEETPVDELANLLDGFADDAERLWPILASAFAEELPWKLLTRALHEIGHQIEVERLYRWVAAVAVTYERRTISTDENSDLLGWLSDNQALARQLISIWIARSVNEEIGLDEQYFLGDLLLSTAPPNFVEWCAQQARARAATDWGLACAFVETPLRHRHWIGDTRDSVIERLRSELTSSPPLLRHLDEFISPPATRRDAREADRQHQQEIDKIRADHERDRQQRQRDWAVHLREHIDELRSNTFAAPNLHAMAMAYFGRVPVVRRDATPDERIADLIGDDAEILEAVVSALREAPMRADVPSAARTAALAAESKHHWLAYPVLAGLDIREAEGILDPSCLADDLRRSAVAIYATTLLDQQQRPLWPVQWLKQNPGLVLDVCHHAAVAVLKNGDTHFSMLNWLDGVEGLDDELRDFRLRLLKSISVRLPVAQLPVVDRLLHGVSEHPDTATLGRLVAQKLRATSMTDGQRVRWLALDAIMRGGDALGALDEFMDANEKRPPHLAAFLCARFHGGSGFVDRLLGSEPIPTLRTLVSVIGRTFPPREWRSGEVVSIGPAERMSDLARRWIDELGGQPVEEASTALDALIADERLGAWRDSLEFTHDKQHRLRRDASYSPMDVADVIGLLRDGPPANVADLHALLCDHLTGLDTYIRGDNSDPWRDFWEDERSQRPSTPRHEETCRDVLLRMLRSRLPDGVDAQPEGQYAADRRADIRVSFKNYNVPVEIKKNAHQDLWTAIEEQLIAKYTIDPDTGGYGIYLVLWFGSDIDGYRGHPTDGDRPGTPGELERRLNESLSHEQRRRIGVVVLDVTKP